MQIHASSLAFLAKLTVVGIAAAVLAWWCLARASERDVVSDPALLKYASSSYDKRSLMNKWVDIGINHGVRVVASFPCSDLCPQYTVRVIQYDVPLSRCRDVGGVEKPISVPRGIAMSTEVFCVPKVLVDNWERYRH